MRAPRGEPAALTGRGSGEARPISETDFVALGDGRWRAWRGIVLRGAGFGVHRVDALADDRLAAAADAVVEAGRGDRATRRERDRHYRDTFAEAGRRLAAAVAAAAADPAVREAITWQNPAFVTSCLDRIPGPTRDSAARARETAVAGYLQRYATKNDTIGFFGPVGWAEWDPDDPRSTMCPGPGLLRERTVRFESWAVDALATALAARPGVRESLAPRRVAAHRVDGGRARLATGADVLLSAGAAATLELCDGTRTAADIAARQGCAVAQVDEHLTELARHDLVRVDLHGPVEPAAQTRLRARLAALPESPARQGALDDLDALDAARARVGASAGDAEDLRAALAALDARFERTTGQRAVRGHGRTYAARTVVFEDTVRDVDVRLGRDVLRELGPPLSLVLDSGRWLAARIAHDYLRVLGGYHDRLARRAGRSGVPLAWLLAPAARDLRAQRGGAQAAQEATAELQRRWARLLAVPAGAQRHDVDPEAIADGVAAAFASGPPPWAGGLRHSPDIMIAAPSIAAIDRGDYRFVLGELHLAHNTVEVQALADQSPDRARIREMAAAVVGDGRVAPVARREWGAETRITVPPWLLSERTRYVALGADDVAHVPGGALPVAGLTVHRVGEALVVRDPEGRMFPLVEVIGDFLTAVVVDAFRILPSRRRSPRVSIGRLVVARETWRLPPRRCDWAHQLDERRRYLQMRAWVTRHGLPRRAFYTLSVEPKPTYVDFTSLALTNRLAGALRRMDRDGADGDVVFTEMLPDAADCWLGDAAGARYTSELRMVVTERAG